MSDKPKKFSLDDLPDDPPKQFSIDDVPDEQTEPTVLQDLVEGNPLIPNNGDVVGAVRTLANNLSDYPVVTPLINKAGEYGVAAARALTDDGDFSDAFKKRLVEEQAVTKHFEDKKKEDNKKHPTAAVFGSIGSAATLPTPSFVGHGWKVLPAEAGNILATGGTAAADTLLRGGSGKDAAINSAVTAGLRVPFSAFNIGREASKSVADFTRKNVLQVSDDLAGRYEANRDAVKQGLATKESADRLLRDLQDEVNTAYSKHVEAPTEASAKAVREAEARLNAAVSDAREQVPFKQMALDKQERVIDDALSHEKFAAERALDEAKSAAGAAKKTVDGKARELKEGLRATHLGQDAANDLIAARKQLNSKIQDSIKNEFDILEKSGVSKIDIAPITSLLEKHRKALEHNSVPNLGFEAAPVGTTSPHIGYAADHAAISAVLSKIEEQYGSSVTPAQARQILMGLNRELDGAFAKAAGGGKMDRADRIVNEARAALRANLRGSLPNDVNAIYTQTADETARLTKLSARLNKVLGSADETTAAGKLERIAERPVLMGLLDDASTATGSPVANKVREFERARRPLKDSKAFEELLKQQPEYTAATAAREAVSRAEQGLDAFHPLKTRPAKEAKLASTKEAADYQDVVDLLRAQKAGQEQTRAWKARAGEVPDVARTPEAAAVLEALSKERALAEQLSTAKEAKTSLGALASVGRKKASHADTASVEALGDMAGRDYLKDLDAIDIIRQIKADRTRGSRNVNMLDVMNGPLRIAGKMAGAAIDKSGGELGVALLDAQRALSNSPFLATFNKIAEERGNEAALAAYRALKARGVVK